MKVLVLSCNTGQGHNTAGRAIVAEMSARGIYCEMVDALAFDSKFTSQVVSAAHAKCALHAPAFYAFAYNTAEFIAKNGGDVPSICYLVNMKYSGKLYRYIEENGYDTMIMTHLFPAESMTRILRKHGRSMATYFIATDYDYQLFLRDTELDGYFIPHASLTHCFTEAGIPAEKIIPTGIPVAETFASNRDKGEARRELGLPEEGRILLVMTGSMGFGPVEKLIEQLVARRGARDTIVVMGGNNEKLKAALRHAYFGDRSVQVLDYTTQVSLYMDAADLLFTKPGGLSITEAAVKGIPVVLTKPIPGWEEDNVRFFRENGLSLAGESAEELADLAFYLLDRPEKAQEMVESQRRTINRRAAIDICDRILADAKS